LWQNVPFVFSIPGKSMTSIRAKRWLLATYTLGLAAIVLQFAAQQWTARGVGGFARATQARHDGAAQNVLESMRQTSHAAIQRGSILGVIGFGVAALAALSLLLSTVNREPGWRLPAGAVLLGYWLFSLMLV
jgi:hypothetical protein